MTALGVIVAIVVGVSVLAWIVALLRSSRLYVGYGAIFIGAVCGALVVLSVPMLNGVFSAASSAILSVPALMVIPVVLLSILMVYVFVQISVLANRVTRLTQELAIRDAQRQQRGN